MTPQPWYTSKTLWTLVVAFGINMTALLAPDAISKQVQSYANELLVVLGIVFRWSADQPLSLTGGVKH